MTYKEITQDLFESDSNTYLAHCISAPTYKTLTEALTDMRDKLPNDCNLNMPCIGSGLDGLNWTAVSAIIRQVFEHTDVNITICLLPERS